MAGICSTPTRWRSSDSSITPSDEDRSRRSSRLLRRGAGKVSSRRIALDALCEWQEGRRFADAILHELLRQTSLSAPDRAFATELVYGVLRNLRLLDSWIHMLRSTEVETGARDLLRVGLYQLLLARI